MHVIHIDRLTVSHAARLIFKDLSWSIGDHDRIGLVGPNGVGKSTLLKAITGEVQPDSGTISLYKGTRLGYLPQSIDLPAGRTLWEEARAVPPELAALEHELARITRTGAYRGLSGGSRRLRGCGQA